MKMKKRKKEEKKKDEMGTIKRKRYEIRILNSIPNVVRGKIPISLSFLYGNKFTTLGYYRDEVVSAYQKCIRRGLSEAFFWAKELWDMKGVSRSNLINRTLITLSEDIGIANPLLLLKVKRMLDEIRMLLKPKSGSDLLIDMINGREEKQKKREKRAEKMFMGIVNVMIESPKSRMMDNIIHSVMLENPFGDEKKPLCKEKYWVGMKGDHTKLEECMNEFIYGMRNNDVNIACYWAEKIYNLDTFNKGNRKTSGGGSSKDPIYVVWKYLVQESLKNSALKGIVRCLFKCFDDIKNGHSERLFLVQAIVSLIYKKDLRRVKNDFVVSKTLWEWIQRHEKLPMQYWAVDIHTDRGRKQKKGVEEFFKVGAMIKDQMFEDKWEQTAKKFAVERYKRGLRVPLRKRVEHLKKQAKLKKSTARRRQKKIKKTKKKRRMERRKSRFFVK